MVEPNPFFPPEGVPLVPEEIAERAAKLNNELLNIWKKRVKIGDAILVQTTSGNSIEGILEQIDKKNCLAEIRLLSGLIWIGLKDVLFIKLICKNINSCDMKQVGNASSDPGETACENKSLIWTKVSIGDSVRILVNSSTSFEAVVGEINFKYGFIALASVSGILYLPADLPISLETLCKERSKKIKMSFILKK